VRPIPGLPTSGCWPSGEVRVRVVGAKSASDVRAELQQKKREDPAHRAERERVESDLAKRVRLLKIAEQPVVADLRAIGLDADRLCRHRERLRDA
jgi:predicted CopG family antitoxin